MNSVLVLLAARNGESYIASQIDSILEQENVHVRVLVGDDCSTDSTVDLLRKSASVSRIHIEEFHQASGGAGQNFIRLLSLADYSGFDYVAFSDQDDIWKKGRLDRAIECLNSSAAQGYSSSVEAFWESGRVRLLAQSGHETALDFLFEGAGQGCTFVMRAELARFSSNIVSENIGLVSEIYYHDWMIYCIARASGRSWYFDTEPSVLYRQHGENDTGARGGLVPLVSRLQKVSAGWYLEQINLMIQLACSVNSKSVPREFLYVWRSSPGLMRKVKLVRWLVFSGRRRLLDRVALLVFTMLGWI